LPAHITAISSGTASSLLALSTGLGTSVLAGQRSADEALAVIRYHLDRLLPTDYRP
jgi:hypothetical protein